MTAGLQIDRNRDAAAGAPELLRPRFKLGLRRVRRGPDALQIGLDPQRAVIVTDLDPCALRWLDRLDGTMQRDTLLRYASDCGLDTDVALRLLTVLGRHDLLEDAARCDRPCAPGADGGDARAGRLRPDQASVALTGPVTDGGRAAMIARAARRVEVRGAARVGAALAGLLAAAGVGQVDVRDPGLGTPADLSPAGLSERDVGRPREDAARAMVTRVGVGLPDRTRVPTTSSTTPARSSRPARATAVAAPDLVVLTDPEPANCAERNELLRADAPHLVACVRETTGIVGPLVLPGRSACLRCLDLTRADRDPGWPRVAAQICAGADTADSSVRACDIGLATAVAAHASLQCLTLLDGGTPSAVDGTLEIALPDGAVRRRSWRAHPACGCDWPEDSEPAA